LKIVSADPALPPHSPPNSNQPHWPIAASSLINSRGPHMVVNNMDVLLPLNLQALARHG